MTIDEDEVAQGPRPSAKFFQEAAERTALPGVATGLAVTGAGGDVLFVEAASMDQRRATACVLTGQLGDVMKESARIALTYVRSHADWLGIDGTRSRGASSTSTCPAGAIPEGRPERRRHDDDGAGVAAHRDGRSSTPSA